MKENTMKFLLAVTIVLAVLAIVIKIANNSGYYRIVKSINANYEAQHQIDYQDEE